MPFLRPLRVTSATFSYLTPGPLMAKPSDSFRWPPMCEGCLSYVFLGPWDTEPAKEVRGTLRPGSIFHRACPSAQWPLLTCPTVSLLSGTRCSSGCAQAGAKLPPTPKIGPLKSAAFPPTCHLVLPSSLKAASVQVLSQLPEELG